jgi:DNA-binding MarR family transcriptional regulator
MTSRERASVAAKDPSLSPRRRVAGVGECDPARCPCDDKACVLSRYARATATAGGSPTSRSRLHATEQAVADRLVGVPVDMPAMAAVSNIYRAANAVRNHLERRVLAAHGLTWTAWVVMWVIWIWGEIESRHLAAEAGISKATLTGVQKTLVAKGLVDRKVHPDDARRTLLSLTDPGLLLMGEVLPAFNAEETRVTGDLDEDSVLSLARSLRTVVLRAERS